MPKIFISHSSKDNDFAAKLADALRERGAEVWIDLADIPAGMKWSTAIQQGLNWAELMLLIITPDSMVSVNVEDEWQYYIDKKKLIVPIRWLPSDVHFQLQRLQYVDFHERNFEAALAKLGKELARSDFELLSPTVEKPNLRQIETDGQTDVPNLTPAQSQTPKGKKPASTSESYKDIRQSPTIIKPNWVGKVIPEPFDWCVIPQGHVILEPTPSEGGYVKVRKKFLVPEFKMARYPITNAQFEAFATAEDGWRNTSWWDYSSDANTWRSRNRRLVKSYFKDCDDCPRENLTWYTMVAFTRWLSAKTGEEIMLPTEQQWQHAALGDDNRIYPWGNEWDAKKCNSRESGNARTTPVTKYPQGASPYGVMDMLGNVMEFCLTHLLTGKSELDGGDERITRGSRFDYSVDYARGINRGWNYPSLENLGVGFRCARSP